MPIGEGAHVVERRAEVQLVAVTLDEADVRRHEHTRVGEQRVVLRANGLVSEHVEGGEAGPTARDRGLERAGRDELRAARVHEERVGLHRVERVRVDEAARRVDEPQVDREHVGAREEAPAVRLDLEPVRFGRGERGRAAVDEDPHLEGAPIPRDATPDLAVAPHAERAARETLAEARVAHVLPAPGPRRRDVVDEPSARREHERPRELRGRHRRADALDDRDASAGARVDVDVRPESTGLRDEPEARCASEEGRVDARALADEHDGVEVFERPRASAVVEDDAVTCEALERGERPRGPLVVVEDRDPHGLGYAVLASDTTPTLAPARDRAQKSAVARRVGGHCSGGVVCLLALASACSDATAFVAWPNLAGFASLVIDDGGAGLRVVSLEGRAAPTLELPPDGALRIAAYLESTTTLALTAGDARVALRDGGRPLPTPARGWTLALDADEPRFFADPAGAASWTAGLAVDEPACRPWRFVAGPLSFDGFRQSIPGPRAGTAISLGAWDGNVPLRARFLSADDLTRTALGAEDVDALFSGIDGAPWLARRSAWVRLGPELEALEEVSTASLAAFGAPRAIVEQRAPPRFVVYTSSDALVAWDPPERPIVLATLPSRARVPAQLLRGDDGTYFVAVADALFAVVVGRPPLGRTTASNDVPFALLHRRAGARAEVWAAELDPLATRFLAWRDGGWVAAATLEAPAAVGVGDVEGRLLAAHPGGIDLVALGPSPAERWRCRVLAPPSGQRLPYAASLSDFGDAVFVEPRASGTATPGWLYPPD